MKTKELIKRLNRIDGVHAEIADSGKICVRGCLNVCVLRILPNALNLLDLNISGDAAANWPFKVKVIVCELVKEYLETPLEERGEEKKYTVQVIKDDDGSYINLARKPGDIFLSDKEATDHVQTKFTRSEIEKFMQRDDIAIDWDKAIIKEVHDDDEE